MRVLKIHIRILQDSGFSRPARRCARLRNRRFDGETPADLASNIASDLFLERVERVEPERWRPRQQLVLSGPCPGKRVSVADRVEGLGDGVVGDA